MDKRTQEALAASLTAETAELIPYLPYLLQDLWELGSSPAVMIDLLRGRLPARARVLDLGCGKGAVSIRMAQALGVKVKGIDLLPAFIEDARQRAQTYGVSTLCLFETGDIQEALARERGYDCVIWGAVGNVLGDYPALLQGLWQATRPGGLVLLDDAYTKDPARVRLAQCPTYAQWTDMFAEAGLAVLEALEAGPEEDGVNEANNRHIRARADELIARHPDKRGLFEGYVQSQQAECDDLSDGLVGVTWLLRAR